MTDVKLPQPSTANMPITLPPAPVRPKIPSLNTPLPPAPPPPPPPVTKLPTPPAAPLASPTPIAPKPAATVSSSNATVRTQSFAASSSPQLAKPKPNLLKIILFAMVGLTTVGLIILGLKNISSKSSSNTNTAVTPSNTSQGDQTGSSQTGSQKQTGSTITLSYWGLWEAQGIMETVIAEYEKSHPNIKIDYRQQSHKDYRERLQTAISSGNGPDIFRFHASWTPMLKAELAPAPSNILSSNQFKSQFYPVAAELLMINQQPVGVPLMYDGLALVYNKEHLKTLGLDQPPQSWGELRQLANQLTVPTNPADRGSKIERAGLAIGTANNVDNFSDIIALLILQNGGDPREPNSQEVRDALLFYTNFVKEDKVWNSTLPSSTAPFARGEVSMILVPSWRIHEIQATNPNLSFGVTTVPTLGENKIAWATFWAEGVSSKSKYSKEAWEFLNYLASKEVLKQFYSAASEVRQFGEIYPRVDMAVDLADSPIVAAYLKDAPNATGWFMSSNTFDNGANDMLNKYYEDAVNSLLQGKTINEVLTTLDQGTKQVIRQYGGV